MGLKPTIRWSAMWRSKNLLDGKTEHLLFENCLPVLFRTRREARKYIADKFSYIHRRPDLQREPHGWKVPIAIKCCISPQRARRSVR